MFFPFDRTSPPARCAPRAGAWVLGLAMFTLLVSSARAENDGGFPVYVRSQVDVRVKAAPGSPPGKTYAVIAMSQIANPEEKLIRPVDLDALLRYLHRALVYRGFHEATAGAKPDILITISFGRSRMRNPYLLGDFLNDLSDDPPTLIATGLPNRYMTQTEAGHEERLQRAQFEKLIIDVTAWKFPAKGEKRHKLWRTTISTDDPDHRDMNQFAEKMLLAGSAFFGRKTSRPEVEITSELGPGQVDVGTPTVVPQ